MSNLNFANSTILGHRRRTSWRLSSTRPLGHSSGFRSRVNPGLIPHVKFWVRHHWNGEVVKIEPKQIGLKCVQFWTYFATLRRHDDPMFIRINVGDESSLNTSFITTKCIGSPAVGDPKFGRNENRREKFSEIPEFCSLRITIAMNTSKRKLYINICSPLLTFFPNTELNRQ